MPARDGEQGEHGPLPDHRPTPTDPAAGATIRARDGPRARSDLLPCDRSTAGPWTGRLTRAAYLRGRHHAHRRANWSRCRGPARTPPPSWWTTARPMTPRTPWRGGPDRRRGPTRAQRCGGGRTARQRADAVRRVQRRRLLVGRRCSPGRRPLDRAPGRCRGGPGPGHAEQPPRGGARAWGRGCWASSPAGRSSVARPTSRWADSIRASGSAARRRCWPSISPSGAGTAYVDDVVAHHHPSTVPRPRRAREVGRPQCHLDALAAAAARHRADRDREAGGGERGGGGVGGQRTSGGRPGGRGGGLVEGALDTGVGGRGGFSREGCGPEPVTG